MNCAPEVHKLLGTGEEGAVRLSVGWATTIEDIDQALRGLDVILKNTITRGA